MWMMQKDKYELLSEFKPAGDQPQAINKLVAGSIKGMSQTLLGVTGSGKTFSMANVIARTGKNALVISHNKTLAAQLYAELRQFFPNNNVGYFVSYYDYYQPESYVPQSDTYIEKNTQINEKIERLRLQATAMLLSGEPTVIVSTVSCIYSLGNPKDWYDMSIRIKIGQRLDRTDLVKALLDARYERNDTEVSPGNFRVRGGTVDVTEAYSEDIIRIVLFGEKIESISRLDHVTLDEKENLDSTTIFPAKHYLVAKDVQKNAIRSIKKELKEHLPKLATLERQRLSTRTAHDIEMIEELGYCSGIENYSRHFDGRRSGQKAFCLLDFFKSENFMLIIDESHVTLPQIRAMYKGDHSRKMQLVDYGFRLPSAYDNRPLMFEEFEEYADSAIFVSATPGEYEKSHSKQIVEQLVRPTGLVDPTVTVRPSAGQMDKLISDIVERAKRNERTLVTTLTKRMAEDVAEYLSKHGVAVRYMHSEIKGLQRTEIIRKMRLGEFDVMVGINLLREGLDIPEVSLVSILDADKEGFLRNATSLIQTFGRAARNSSGAVVMYADVITNSMKIAISETERRRDRQQAYNKRHGITPTTIIKAVPKGEIEIEEIKHMSMHDLNEMDAELEAQMKKYSHELDFERAIECRERIKRIHREIEYKNEK
ncbi:MAG: excinuclease ABC subunit B [Cenarchaeum symbiont of Oopsacas minuta]|nr:excinuclease ABC subunit B [Cenarchaeum symbiont of Oopsacas minuta]